MHNSFERFLRTVGPSQSGMAMLMALVVIMVLALISVGLANLAVSEFSSAVTVDRSAQAFQAAEAGGELALNLLRPVADWGTVATSATAWTPLRANVAFPDPAATVCASPPCTVGQFTVAVRRIAGQDPTTNVAVRSLGTVRGASRTIEFDLHRLSGTDFTTYSIRTVDITNISGGGSLQFHGSAYFEGNLILRGAAQAGFFNDRYVSLSDAPRYLNHLYVRGNLDTSTGNPTIGSPYYWVHVAGSIIGIGNNFNVTNLDSNVPPPFYPDVMAETRRALDTPGNLLVPNAGTLQLVRCRWQGSGWVRDTPNPPNLILAGSQATDTFFLPPATANPVNSCAGYPNSISQVRAQGQYALMWDAADANPLVFRNDALPVYIPGQVRLGRDIRYEGRGTIVVGNQPGATVSSQLVAQSGCGFDFNGNSQCGTQQGNFPGYTLRARVSPCGGTLTDNPDSTYARINPSYPTSPDVAVILVNGSAHADVNSNSCAQEMNLVAIVGARESSPGAAFRIQRKLQWYGILMTREMALGQVPDFWQMPDMVSFLPAWARRMMAPPTNPILVRNWRERF